MNVLFCPIFSMRSYETGKYAILKDGNFQLTMARVLASDFRKIFVAVPEDSSDYDDLIARFQHLDNVYFWKMKYGMNAVQTREQFWDLNAEFLDYFPEEYGIEVLISDITGYKGKLPVIFNFNITELPELDRPYIDKFFESDLESIGKSLFTTVLNPRQREYILELRPDLEKKVIVNTKCAHEELLPTFTEAVQKASSKTIFWPFRLTDKAYRWFEFLQAFEAQKLDEAGFKVVITDPNESLDELMIPEYVTKIKPTKSEYYYQLASAPIVVMLDDIDTVLHPGTIEFFHYGCPVIAFKAKLIYSPNAIDDLKQLSDAVRYPVYNKIDTSPFVYSRHEIDSYYNQVFVNDRKN